MTPMPINPTVVIRLSRNGEKITAIASNLDPELKVVLTSEDEGEFESESAGLPFDSERKQ